MQRTKGGAPFGPRLFSFFLQDHSCFPEINKMDDFEGTTTDIGDSSEGEAESTPCQNHEDGGRKRSRDDSDNEGN